MQTQVSEKLEDFFIKSLEAHCKMKDENSFRKLWSLSERIIKDIFGHNIGFMKVGEYMETILYKYGYKKYFYIKAQLPVLYVIKVIFNSLLN